MPGQQKLKASPKARDRHSKKSRLKGERAPRGETTFALADWFPYAPERAEYRELKLKERLVKVTEELNGVRADNDTLRRAVEVLQSSLREATSSGGGRTPSLSYFF